MLKIAAAVCKQIMAAWREWEHGESEKWLGSGCVLKVEPRGFAESRVKDGPGRVCLWWELPL